MRIAQRQLDELLPLTIVEQAIDAIIATGGDGRIVFFNPAAERMFCCAAQAAAGQPLDRFLIRYAPDHGAQERILVHAVRADGKTFAAEAAISTFDIAGQTLRAIILREARNSDLTPHSCTPTPRHLTDSLDRQAKRIGQALHHEAGQLLVSAHLALTEAARDVPPAVQSRLEEVRRHLNRIEDQLRRLAHELRPQILDDLGLVQAVEFLANGAEQRWGVAITVDAALGGRLPTEIETAVYRLTLEALTNASRHARARRMRVRFEQTADALCCAIEDDGVGFDVRAISTRSGERGFGLLGLNDQVQALGGQFLIDSAPGRGTKVMAMIPFKVQSCH